jgi:hypothetical protein
VSVGYISNGIIGYVSTAEIEGFEKIENNYFCGCLEEKIDCDEIS